MCGDSAWQIGVKNRILNPVLFGFKFNLKVARWEFGMKFEPQNFKFLRSVTCAWVQKPPADLFLWEFGTKFEPQNFYSTSHILK